MSVKWTSRFGLSVLILVFFIVFKAIFLHITKFRVDMSCCVFVLNRCDMKSYFIDKNNKMSLSI